MIRLREFNMAELEYFIDPEVTPQHDFSSWNNTVTLIADGKGVVEMTFQQAVDEGVIRHPTVGISWLGPWISCYLLVLILKAYALAT